MVESKVAEAKAEAKKDDGKAKSAQDKYVPIPAAGQDPDSKLRVKKHQDALDANK